MSSTAIAEFECVSKVYSSGWRRTVSAVTDVSFQVEPGEVFGLLGPNRAGKTTLVKMLLSLCRPTSGKIRRFGQALAVRGTLAHIGYVHENQAFPHYLTAAGLLEFYGALSGLSQGELRRHVPRLLELVGLMDRGAEPIARFSKGMVQRLSLAQALLNDPELLVLDEPAEGLDLEGRRLVRAIVQERRRQGRSALLISHSLADVTQLCDRVAVLVQGQLAYLGPLADLTGADRSLEAALHELYGLSGKRYA